MRSVTLLRLTVGLGVVVALYQAALFRLGHETSDTFDVAWSCVLPSMLAFWVDEDSKGRSQVYRPSFDIGLFMYLLWIFYLPYYLIRTRGKAGWLWIVGLFSLVFLGTVLQLAIYAAG